MFYDVFCELCASRNLTPSGGAAAIGFNRATVTTWKNSGKAPKGDILLKIAKHFEVPVDFLLQRPPFEYWDAINADRRGLIAATGIDSETLQLIWGIDALDPYACRLQDFVSFLSIELLSAAPDGDGGWNVVLRPEHKKVPVLTEKDERDIARDLARIMAQLDAGGDLMFDGDPMSEEARESIKAAMKLGLEAAKVKNKERFTPKPYRKE